MDRLHMLMKAAFVSCLIVTKLTTMFREHSYITKSILGGLSKECQKLSKITFKGHYWSKTTDFSRFLKCLFKCPPSDKALGHWLQGNIFSQECVLKCLFKYPLSEKALGHWLQGNGFSPECVLKWLFK